MKYPDAAAASGMITRSVPPARASTLPPTPCHAVHRSTSVKCEDRDRHGTGAACHLDGMSRIRPLAVAPREYALVIAEMNGQIAMGDVTTGVAAPVFVNS